MINPKYVEAYVSRWIRSCTNSDQLRSILSYLDRTVDRVVINRNEYLDLRLRVYSKAKELKEVDLVIIHN